MKKRIFLILIVCMAVFLSGCDHIETTDPEKYCDFYQQMQQKNASFSKYIPEPADTLNIEEVYLYYTDRDPYDSRYAVYVNCAYSSELYEEAKDVARDSYGASQYSLTNSPSFGYESVMLADTLDTSFGGFIDYDYVLFDDTEKRIVYVHLFEVDLKGQSVNIPEEYLPKELRDIHNS